MAVSEAVRLEPGEEHETVAGKDGPTVFVLEAAGPGMVVPAT